MKFIADITCIVYPNEVMVVNDTSSDTMTVDDFYSSTKFMVISKRITLSNHMPFPNIYSNSM